MSGLSALDTRWLDSAVRLAWPHIGTTGEQPTVGALVVDEGLQLVFGRGVTARGGAPGGIEQALADARSSARGRTLYTTLEPGSGWHLSPHCAEAVVAAGVGRVVVGLAAPEPGAAGTGCARLRAAGIEVLLTAHAPSHGLHEAHVTRHREERPFVAARLAVSADGKVGLPDRGRALVLEPPAERWLQMQRARCDAIMIGARTARIDDPDLTLRIRGLGDRSYRRLVAVGRGTLDPDLNLIAWVSGYPTAIVAEQGRDFEVPSSVEVIAVAGRKGWPDLRHCLRLLAARGLGRLLVEGGPRLVESFIAGELLDRFHLLETAAELGRSGVPAAILGDLDGRLRAAGFVEVDRQPLGADKLRTFEREI